MTDPLEQARQDLQSDDQETRDRGIRRLGITPGEEARSHLLRLVKHAESSVRARAVRMLGLHHRRPETLAALLERLRTDHSGEVRAATIFGLEEFEPAEWSSAVLEALSDPDDEVVSTACHVLSFREVRPAVGRLVELLEHPAWSVRWSAAVALERLDEHHERLSETFERLIIDAPSDVHPAQIDMVKTAFKRLRTAGDAGHDPYLAAESDLRQGDPDIRRRAADTLRGLEGPRAVAALLPALDDPAPRVRAAAALTLGMWAVPEALPGLGEHLLTDESQHVRRMCSAFMHYFPAADAVPHLIPALKDADWGVVMSCCTSLGHLRDPSAIPHLLEILDHSDWTTRLQACWALVKLGASDRRLVATLERLMQAPEAAEYDLEMDEMNAMPELWDEAEGEEGEAPESAPKLQDLLDRARVLLA